MQFQTVDIDKFLELVGDGKKLLLDVRSEKEFEKAHIPHAVSLPLLSNADRHEVGIVYKSAGRQAAVLEGFTRVGPRFHEIIRRVMELAGGREVLLYCWRGGMRSNITAWMLQLAGLRVTLLRGGYKAFRRKMLTELDKSRSIIILGGKTGSGKTELLQLMREAGHAVIDLEGLAHHKGSAYGLLGQPPQPTQEQFENLLAWQLSGLSADLPVWLENESRLIGRIVLPSRLFDLMRQACVAEVMVSRSQREERILNEYGIFPAEDLATHTRRIGKRLGPLLLKEALTHLEKNDLRAWLKIVLDYYDSSYAYSNSQRDPLTLIQIPLDWENPQECIAALLKIKLR